MIRAFFKKPYIYTLKEAERFDTKISLEHIIKKSSISFSDGSGWWLMINSKGVLVVNERYSWDGCSPKIKLFGKVLGVPDGPSKDFRKNNKGPSLIRPVTWRASLFHDVLCQFQDHPEMPFDREQIDLIFLNIMQEDGFDQAKIYHRVVRLLGRPHAIVMGYLRQKL